MSLIQSIAIKDEYRVEALLDNGSFICWGKKVEISVSELFQLAQK